MTSKNNIKGKVIINFNCLKIFYEGINTRDKIVFIRFFMIRCFMIANNMMKIYLKII